MKRHGFKGLRASHGVSISHRSAGSTGQHQDPGRVFPGKKMAGRMGGKSSTAQNLLCLRVNNEQNLVYLKGAVPGYAGAIIRLQDAVRKRAGGPKDRFGVSSLPFPAATAEAVEQWALPSEVALTKFS
jgi:large subunit ribosomal protein L3